VNVRKKKEKKKRRGTSSPFDSILRIRPRVCVVLSADLVHREVHGPCFHSSFRAVLSLFYRSVRTCSHRQQPCAIRIQTCNGGNAVHIPDPIAIQASPRTSVVLQIGYIYQPDQPSFKITYRGANTHPLLKAHRHRTHAVPVQPTSSSFQSSLER
jgi:hypothetical protein